MLPIAWQVARANQHQAEQLVATERRFRAIFDQTFQFIGLLDVEGTLLEANQTALDFAGLRPQDVIGKPFWETPWWSHSPALQERLRQAIRAAGRGEVVRFEATHPGRDDRLHHIDFSLKPVYDASGAVILLIPEGRDITERKEAEDALRRSEERFRFLVQNQTEFIVSCQPDGDADVRQRQLLRVLRRPRRGRHRQQPGRVFRTDGPGDDGGADHRRDPAQARRHWRVPRDRQGGRSSDGRTGRPAASSMPTASSPRFS